MLKPVTPLAPTRLKRNPPTTAPTTPSTMSSRGPSPDRFTILLAMNPAMRPKTIQAMIPMVTSWKGPISSYRAKPDHRGASADFCAGVSAVVLFCAAANATNPPRPVGNLLCPSPERSAPHPRRPRRLPASLRRRLRKARPRKRLRRIAEIVLGVPGVARRRVELDPARQQPVPIVVTQLGDRHR